MAFFPAGIIRTALPNMDREARQEYDVVIQAKDMGGHMGGLSGTTEVKITLTDVNDNPPKFPQSESVFLPSPSFTYSLLSLPYMSGLMAWPPLLPLASFFFLSLSISLSLSPSLSLSRFIFDFHHLCLSFSFFSICTFNRERGLASACVCCVLPEGTALLLASLAPLPPPHPTSHPDSCSPQRRNNIDLSNGRGRFSLETMSNYA